MFDRRTEVGRDSVARWMVVTVCAALSGCGGTIQFADTTSLVVVGEPPKPPEPEPPPPPKPKRVEVTQDKIVITEKIQFDFNKATIKPESHALLDEIVEVIRDNAHIRKIAIEGHTDSDGGDGYNLKLSDDRAKSVQAYLVDHGIDAGRLSAKGFGETKPVGDNATDAGKEQNRRVEFLITEQDEVTKTFEVDPETGEQKEVKEKKKKKKAKKEEQP